MRKEIKIIGAGLSGLTAAINLAKAGYKVKVFEKNEVIGKRFHGDYQGVENWFYNQDALEHIRNLNLEINFPYYPVNELKFIGPYGKVYYSKSNKNFFYLVRRGVEQNTLDQSLYKQAYQAGVEIIFNAPRDHRKFGDIVAQGYFPDEVTDAIVVGYNFKTNLPNQYWVIIDDSVGPDGYAYCLIAGGQATLAICIFRDFGNSQKYLKKAYDIFQRKIGFRAENKKFFGGTSNAFIMKTAIFNNRLYVGEAAGFIDPLWGFGMKFAMISGYLAAKSIIENKNYDKLWKKEIYRLIKTSLVNRWYYKLLRKKTYQLILKKMENSQDPFLFLKKLVNPSLLHDLSFPLAWFFWKRKAKDRRKFKIKNNH